jgi:uncharacterized OB-fold protein
MAGRTLPSVTAETEFFWTSGADGRLRVLECRSCLALIHPPQPVCRYCRGHDIAPMAVSGYATLIGFTVNHRFPAPGLTLPYVVAQVALEEDPRVRLTTNVVDVEPDQLRLGMRMRVVFEQDGDVWLPLFRPAQADRRRPTRPRPTLTPRPNRWNRRRCRPTTSSCGAGCARCRAPRSSRTRSPSPGSACRMWVAG